MNLQQLREKHAQLLREATALKGADGKFADDQARAAFDTKMTEVETIAGQIASKEAEERAAATPTQPTADQVRQQAIDAERSRAAGIRDAVRVAKLEPAVADDMVSRGITIDATRSEIFAKMAARSNENPTSTHIIVGEDKRDKWLRGATNWLLIKAGQAQMVARHEKVELSTIDAGEFRGATLVDLAREVLERSGRPFRGRDKMQLVADAFTLRDATQGTSDFTTLLENVMHKVLQAAYAMQPDTWKRFCNQSTVADFRAHNRYRFGTIAALDSLNELGEFKNKAISDAEKASITATTKGNIIAISRQSIVNDDLGAFTQLLAMLGRASARSVEIDVYASLTSNAGLGPTLGDGNTLFHASHNNLGSGSAIAAAALDADRVVLASQKDKDGNDYLDLRPTILVLPIGLGGVAKVINQSQYDPDTVANKAQFKPNVVVGLFADIVDTPRLTGTRRYLFADPGLAPVLEVAFLEGQTAPFLETRDGWRVDGAEMKVRFDYGVAGVDFRGAVTNAGA